MSGPVLHVVGARPNFPKAAPVISGLDTHGISQLLVHTGQHYDRNMSEVFFDQLGLPRPDINLGVGAGSHATQTAAIMIELEKVFLHHGPRIVVVYGDVNSTVAAALVAAKLGIEVAHVEAGLRSFDRAMPEEVNRVITDQLSHLLLVTSPEAIDNLAREGVDPLRCHLVGNPMIDTLIAHQDALDPAGLRSRLGLSGPYVLATVHRPSNVDDPTAAADLVATLHAVAEQVPVLLPLHPRGRQRLAQAGLHGHAGLRVIEPLGYLEFMSLLADAAAVITDSGGVQEETTVLGVPCLTVRTTTERPITITNGTNQLVTLAELPGRVTDVLAAGRPIHWPTPPLWDGHSGERIAAILAEHIPTSLTHA